MSGQDRKLVEKFLTTVFGSLDGVWLGSAEKEGDAAGMHGGWAKDWLDNIENHPDWSHYYNNATIRPGSSTRNSANFEALRVFVIDDVGTPGAPGVPNQISGAKIDIKDLDPEANPLLPLPTFIVETSAGNFQYIYALQTPETDRERCDFFRKNFYKLPWAANSDPTSLAHYYRLPCGINVKPIRNKFRTRLGPREKYDPDAKFTLERLAAVFGFAFSDKLIADAALKAAQNGGAAASPSGTVGDVKEVIALLNSIPNSLFGYHEWIALGLKVKGASGGDPDARDAWIKWSSTWDGTGGSGGGPQDAADKWDNGMHSPTTGLEELRSSARHWWTEEAKAEPDPKKHKAKPGLVAAWAFSTLADPVDQARVDEVIGQLVKENSPEGAAQKFESALRALRGARDEPGQNEAIGTGLFEGVKREVPLKRANLTPWHSRATVTTMAAAGGTGKTTLMILVALAMAYERHDLLGLSAPFDWLGDIVMVLNEDRHAVPNLIQAAEIAHGLDPVKDQKHRIHVYPHRLAVANVNYNKVSPSPGVVPFVQWLAKIRTAAPIGMLVLDHLGSISGGAKENSAEDTGAVMGILADIAEAGFLSVSLTHHNNKKGDFRGSTAIYDMSRSFLELKLDDQIKNLLRLSHIKANARRTHSEIGFNRDGQDIPVRDVRLPLTAPLLVENFPIVRAVKGAMPPAKNAGPAASKTAFGTPIDRLAAARKGIAEALGKGMEVREVKAGRMEGAGWVALRRVVELALDCPPSEAAGVVADLKSAGAIRVSSPEWSATRNTVVKVDLGEAPF